LLIGFHAHELCIIVLFDRKEDLLLITKCYQVFLRLILHVPSNLVQQCLLLFVLFLTHVFDQLESSGFV
jgi:hypothetical protein